MHSVLGFRSSCDAAAHVVDAAGHGSHASPSTAQAAHSTRTAAHDLSLVTILMLLTLAISTVMRAAVNAIQGVRERSATDTLSGLLNRASFDERAGAAAASALSGGLCVVAFDIDHFKQVNDTAGHATGDRVISALGSRDFREML